MTQHSNTHTANSSFELGGEAQSFQTGIGRPISQKWCDKFEAVFKEVAPKHCTLAMRKIPGSIYVAAYEYARLDNAEYDGEESEEETAEEIERDMKDMREDGVLKESSAQEQPVEMYKAGISAKPRGGVIRIAAYVIDPPTDEYPEGHLFAGEAAAINDDLEVRDRDQDQSMQVVKTRRLGIAVVHSEVKFNFQTELLTPIRTRMSKYPLTLGPIGPVRGVQ